MFGIFFFVGSSVCFFCITFGSNLFASLSYGLSLIRIETQPNANEWEKSSQLHTRHGESFFYVFSGPKNDIEHPKKNYETTFHVRSTPSEHVFMLFVDFDIVHLWRKKRHAASE